MQHKKNVMFYIMPPTQQKQNTINFETKFICNLTKTEWRSGKIVFIACENKPQAIKIDEALWNFDQNSFLPHNLIQKNLHNIPIAIHLTQYNYNNKPKNILINLMHKNTSSFLDFDEIIDFVPNNKILKQLARIRYKIYKQTGFQLHVTNIFNNNLK